MGEEKNKGGRINSLNVGGFKSQNGNWTVNTGDAGNEQTLRGGSGTSQSEAGSPVGGGLSPEGVKNGYPSNS